MVIMFISVKKSILKSICTFCLLLSVAIVSAQVPQSERDALIALYNTTDGPNWSRNENWLSEDVSTWYGVSVFEGHVVLINLYSNSLNGELPSEIGNLESLIYLYLGRNELTGSIPVELFNLPNCEKINISYNNLTGEIPDEIVYNESLLFLELDNNKLSGAVPLGLTSLTNLVWLYLNNNKINDLPDFSDWNTTIRVSYNNLTFEDIEPNINLPGFQYDNQSIIPVEDNYIVVDPGAEEILTVNVAGVNNRYQWFKDGVSITPVQTSPNLVLTNYSSINNGRYTCQITNTIATDLTLTSEEILVEISKGGVGLQEYNALVELYNKTNGDFWNSNSNWLSNDVSGWYGVTVENKSVVSLDLSNNNLKGTVPGDISQLAGLLSLNLSHNGLVGELPDGTSNFMNLKHFNVAHNMLIGDLLWRNDNFGTMETLETLIINDNNFGPGIFSSQYNNTSLTTIEIQNNQFNVLPDLSGYPITTFNVQNNNFTFEDIESNIAIVDEYAPQKEVPVDIHHIALLLGEDTIISVQVNGENNRYQWFKDGTSLTPVQTSPDFVLSDFSLEDAGNYICHITNTVANELTLYSKPVYVETMQNGVGKSEYDALIALYNSTDGGHWTNKNNWLNGDVSSWYGVQVVNSHVTSIDLMENNLCGFLPAELGNLISCESIDFQDNSLSGEIPIELQYMLNLKYLRLELNQLSGPIPIELSNIENLVSLGLGDNQLTGQIPGEIGKLKKLGALSLYFNELSGTIPYELINLKNTEFLLLSNNHFEGEVSHIISELNNLRYLLLANNQFTGGLPADLGSLSQLDFLIIANNLFTDLPDLSNLTNRYIVCNDNLLTFADLEPNISVLHIYSPQAKLPVETNNFEKTEGESLNLTVDTDGANNQYQWFRDGTALSSISGNPEFEIISLVEDDSGVYTCHVTNTVVTGLTLQTEDIEVNISKPAITQTIHLNINWNIFSTYVEPLDNSCSAVIGDAGLTSSMSIVKNEAGAAYFPSLDFGGFTTFDVGEGYQAKMISGEDFEITGVPIDPEDVTLTLQSGWNMLGYLRQSSGALTDMLDPVLGSIEIIKDESGLAYYPSLGFGLLNTLEPGEGYMVKMVSQASFSYPSNGAKSGLAKPNVDEEPQYFGSPKNTGFNMTLIIPENAWDIVPENGDELAVSAPDGRLVGSAVLKNAHNMLPVFGNDLTSEINGGLSDGEAFTLQLWHKSSGEIQTLEITNWQDWAPGQQIYQHNGIAVVGQIKTGSTLTGINPETGMKKLLIYPNPVQDILNISHNFKTQNELNISIYNCIGQIVKHETFNHANIDKAGSASIHVEALPKGVYTVCIRDGNNCKYSQFVKE